MDVPAEDVDVTSLETVGPDEEYISLPRSELASDLNVSDIPDTLGGLRYQTSFSYLGGQMVSARRYAIWSDATGRQIQVIIGSDPVTSVEPVIERSPGTVSLSVKEGKRSLQIIATDDVLLRAAVSRFRPSYILNLD